ncbi:MAG: hypothetical protein JEZ14_04570 [Marinilabiliaceae bacterium]|nr:hypothetical protein [Marinilabiliaceae bacterium]
MKRYVEQLMEDIDLAKSNAERRLSSYFECDHSAAYHFIEDDSDEAGIRISDLIGLEVFVFPKSEHLGEEELLDLSNAMIALLQNYGFNPMFGSCVPNQIKYSLMRRAINHRVYPGENQMVDLELCDYLPQYCPFAVECPAHTEGRGECCTQKRA